MSSNNPHLSYPDRIQAQLHEFPDLASEDALRYLRAEGPTCLPEVLVIQIRQAIQREDVGLEFEQAALEALLHPKPGIPIDAPAARIARTIDGFARRKLWGPKDNDRLEEFRAHCIYRLLQAVQSTASAERGWQESFFGRLTDRLKNWRDEFNRDWERRGFTGNRTSEPAADIPEERRPSRTAEKKTESEKEQRQRRKLFRFVWGEIDPELHGHQPDPLNDLWAQRVREELDAALDSLDPHLARTLRLYLADHPVGGSHGPLPSISAIMGITPRAVYARIENAKQRLQTNARLVEFQRSARVDSPPLPRPDPNDRLRGGHRG